MSFYESDIEQLALEIFKEYHEYIKFFTGLIFPLVVIELKNPIDENANLKNTV